MADVSTLSTFTRTIFGNRIIEVVDIPGGGSTQDLIVARYCRPISAFANFRGSTAGSSSNPALTVDGTTVGINQLAATTAAAYTVTIIGR